MNDIIKILNIEDDQISVIGSWIDGPYKYIEITKKDPITYCPNCGNRMHSKGLRTRKVNHSILIDGFKLTLLIHQRRWKCPNCNLYCTDCFTFVDRYKRQTNLLPYIIINALKDTNRTVAEVARMFNVSDTYVHEIFMSYLDIKRLPFPEVLCIDEVFLNIKYDEKYACVLMDFKTRKIVDILRNRWQPTLDKYFLSIPLEERKKVKFIVCDMYDTYVSLPKSYFPNSVVIIDSFHVISNLNNKLTIYINSVKRRYEERDKRLLAERNKRNNTNHISMKKSKEVNILINYRHFLLGNPNTYKYRVDLKYDRILHFYANDYDREKAFLELDAQFTTLRNLKQKYLNFNSSIFNDSSEAAKELDKLIDEYDKSENAIFIEFSRLLKRYRDPIIASFNYYTLETGEITRLSNGPMEGFNRTPKDMKRDARGFEVFEYIRARLIFGSREKVPFRSSPKDKDEIPRSKKAYRKNKKKK